MKTLLMVFAVSVIFTQGVFANDRIVLSGTDRCEIVVPPDACPVVRFAGKELQYFLSKSLNTKIPVVKTPNPGVTSIILGKKLLSEDIDISKLPRDAYIIKSLDGNIYIAGKDDPQINPAINLKGGAHAQLYERGTLMGVYGFLEQFAGIRFYFPGEIGTVVPRHEKLVLPPVNITIKPDYIARNFTSYSGITPDGKKGKNSYFFKNLNYYRLKMQTSYIPNCHGLSRLGYIKRFGKTHPEYFALQSNGKRYNDPAVSHSGQLCFSSGIRQQIFEDARAFLSGKSAKEAGILTGRFGYCWDPSAFRPGYFNIMPQDGFYKCRCLECQKHFSKGAAATSEFIWDFVCETAEKLKKNNIPGYLTMMAYPPYNIVPERKIPDNVLVMVQERGPWSMRHPEIFRKEQNEIKAWTKKVGRKIWLWNYPNKYGRLDIPGIPALTPLCIGKYYKLNRPYIFGAYMESETDFYIFNYLNYYVFSKVCWDNTTDVEKLLEEHYRKMFGPAAKIMEQVFQDFENKWLIITGKTVDSHYGPTCHPVTRDVLWNKIYGSAEIARLEKCFAEAVKLSRNDPDSLKRVQFVEKHFLDRLKKQREKYFENKRQTEDLTLYAAPVKESIIIDGKLNDPAWKQAGGVYLVPFKGTDSQKLVKTIVKVLCDSENLYVSYFCEEPLLKKIQTVKRKPDDLELYKDSSIELFLNPAADKKSYYQLIVNASGSLADIYYNGEKKSYGWNSAAKIAIGKMGGGWTVEIAVPLKSFKHFSKRSFPVNFNRNRVLVSDVKEYVRYYSWSPFLVKSFNEIDNFGQLIFKKETDNNLVKNGTFIIRPKGLNLGDWYAPPLKSLKTGSSFSIDKNIFIKGGQSLKMSAKVMEKNGVMQRLPALKPDTEYRLTFFMKTADVKGLHKKYPSGICVNIWDRKNIWFPKVFITGTTPWTKYGFKFKSAPAGKKAAKNYIKLWLMFASGTVWFDDIKLEEVK